MPSTNNPSTPTFGGYVLLQVRKQIYGYVYLFSNLKHCIASKRRRFTGYKGMIIYAQTMTDMHFCTAVSFLAHHIHNSKCFPFLSSFPIATENSIITRVGGFTNIIPLGMRDARLKVKPLASS